MLLLALIFLMLGAGGILSWLAHEYGPAGERQQRFLRFIISTATFQVAGLVAIHAFIRWHGQRWWNLLGLETRPLRWIVLSALVLSVFAIPATILLNSLVAWGISQFQDEPGRQPVMVVLQESGTIWERMALGVAAILIAPIFEETLFRGILYPAIKQAGYPGLALAGTSLLFGAIHATLVTFLPLTFLAIMFALLYEKTDSLLAPIIAHSLFNAVNFAMIVVASGKPILTG